MSFLPTSQILTLASSILVLALAVSPLQGRELILLEKGKLLGEATFEGGKPTRQNVAAKKEARLNDERYQAMLKHLDSLERRELAYFQTVDSALRNSVYSK